MELKDWKIPKVLINPRFELEMLRAFKTLDLYLLLESKASHGTIGLVAFEARFRGVRCA